jgi:predicted ATPase
MWHSSASERHPLPNLSPQRKKERTLEALLRQLEGLARRQPVLMIFEDAHWADPTSRELLDLTVERVRRLPVLVIVTFRPEFQPDSGGTAQGDPLPPLSLAFGTALPAPKLTSISSRSFTATGFRPSRPLRRDDEQFDDDQFIAVA